MLTHYVDLMSAAGMPTGLQKYSGSIVRQRGSSPKLQVLDTALMAAPIRALARGGASRPRLPRPSVIESAIGAHLANAVSAGECELLYWPSAPGSGLRAEARKAGAAIEVKSGASTQSLLGLSVYSDEFKPAQTVLVGADGVPITEFLVPPAGR
jgi:hypothetical protein